MSYIINGLLSNQKWHPMVVKHKQTHEVLTIKSIRFDAGIHELLKEHASSSLETEIPFVGTAIHYDLKDGQNVKPEAPRVEPVALEEPTTTEVKPEDDEVEVFMASLPEDLDERFELVKAKTKEYPKYFNAPLVVKKEYERLKKILNK